MLGPRRGSTDMIWKSDLLSTSMSKWSVNNPSGLMLVALACQILLCVDGIPWCLACNS